MKEHDEDEGARRRWRGEDEDGGARRITLTLIVP